MEHTYRLTISCPDRVGIVARVSQFVAEQGGWLTEANYHADAENTWFFMRNEIKADSLNTGLPAFRAAFADIATEYGMEIQINDGKL